MLFLFKNSTLFEAADGAVLSVVQFLQSVEQVKILKQRKCDNEVILQNISNKNQNTGAFIPVC